MGRLPSFGTQFSLGGGGGGGARTWPGGARRNFMVRISVLARKSGVKTENKKTRYSARNLRLHLVHLCFSSWNETLLTLGVAKAVFWGVQAPKCTPVAPCLLLSFGAQSLLGETHFLLGGWHISCLGGGTAPKFPRGAGSALFYHHKNACFGE